jgi:acyl-CoA synthetase (NDP forming)
MKLDFDRLARGFNPKCVAVVGDNERFGFGWLRAEKTFKGSLYSIQTNPKTVKLIDKLGIKNYSSLLDIPEPLDLVIVSVPRNVVPKILEDCIQKDVAVVHLFTAGFTETGTKEGKELEEYLVQRANEVGLPIIGPNCMGIYNPRIGLRQTLEQKVEVGGPVGFISQSGTHAENFAKEGYYQGVYVNKSVSFGNGSVLDSTDYLEYFGHDESIQAIGIYIEGVKDGRRFFNVLKMITQIKPVVIWKGGYTEAGGRAIASHTASLTIPNNVWNAMIKQAGAIQVDSFMELIDTLKILIMANPIISDRVGIVGGSGGESVVLTDKFAGLGLKVPPLTQESYDQFAEFFSVIGGSFRNPVDNGNVSRMFLERTVEILEKDSNIDNLVIQLSLLPDDWLSHGSLDNDVNSLIHLRQRALKPVIVIIPTIGMSMNQIETAIMIRKRLQDGHIPVFNSIERGARALRNVLPVPS